ncbi:MAG TPA: outer membrane lipoprotein-sorting protein [Bryobacteraceae bacterium]|nr:outer membrane lipoprotein-sorting protein [Bryobacteraceae bacterium]
MSRLTVVSLVAVVMHAADARGILEEVERRNRFSTQEHEATVEFFQRSGTPLVKRWRLRSSGGEGSRKVLIRFTYPPEVRGAALLILNQPRGPAVQWMWIPSIGRDRRIAPQDRSTSVLGTDLTFEDLEERSLSNFHARLDGESTVDGVSCHRIITTPKDATLSSYSSSVLWVDKTRLVVMLVENRRQEKTVRSLRFSAFKDVQGILTPHTLEAINQEAGTRTVLNLKGVKYNTSLRESDFTREAMRTSP